MLREVASWVQVWRQGDCTTRASCNEGSFAVQAETMQPAAQALALEAETAATQGGSFLGKNLLAQLAELGMDAARLEREHPAAAEQVQRPHNSETCLPCGVWQTH